MPNFEAFLHADDPDGAMAAAVQIRAAMAHGGPRRPPGRYRGVWEELPTEPIPTYRAPNFPVLRVPPDVRRIGRGGIG